MLKEPLPKDEVEYPCDTIRSLIEGNSPYAFYFFQWVPYQEVAKKWRLKLMHDAKAFDGREVHCEWPNGQHIGELHDDEIEFIRISKNQIVHEYEDPRGGA